MNGDLNDQLPCEFIAHSETGGAYASTNLRVVYRLETLAYTSIEIEIVWIEITPDVFAALSHGFGDEACRFILDIYGARFPVEVTLDRMLISSGWMRLEGEQLESEVAEILNERMAA